MGGKTFAGKTSAALDRVSSRGTINLFSEPLPEFMALLADPERRQASEQWLESLRDSYLWIDVDQSQEHFRKYLQQVAELQEERYGLSSERVGRFIRQVQELIDENIRDSCEQSAANIAAIIAHLDPNFDQQAFFQQLDGFDQNYDFDHYSDYIYQQIDQQEMQLQVDKFLAQHGDDNSSRGWIESEIHGYVVEDPRNNEFISVDIDDYDSWVIEQRRQEVHAALQEHQAPVWLWDQRYQAELLQRPEMLIAALTGYDHGPPGGIKQHIERFYRQDSSQQFFFDPETKTFAGNHRSYQIFINDQLQQVTVREKRTSDGRGLQAEIPGELTINLVQTANNDHNGQPITRARIIQSGSEPRNITVSSSDIERDGGFEAWILNTLERTQSRQRLEERLSANDPEAQARRLAQL